MRGVRVQRATLLGLAVPESAFPCEPSLDLTAGLLRDRYGLPVGGMEAVPTWVTANDRPEGGPPDDVHLDLDLSQLDLSAQPGHPASE